MTEVRETSLWEVLVPTVSNEGRPFRTRHHREWDARVLRVSGGLTLLPPSRGKWVSPSGREYHDRVIPVRVACTREEILEVARITIRHYGQEAVMVYRVSSESLVVHRDGPGNT